MPEYSGQIDNSATQNDGTEGLAVNDSLVRRALSLFALEVAERLPFKPWRVEGVPVSKHLTIKTGPWVHLTEAATLRFVRENTAIPVPRVHCCAFVHKNQAFIVMERIQGITIVKVWKSLTDLERGDLLEQLRLMFKELRSLAPPPDAGIASCVGGSLGAARMPRAYPRFGPFNSIHDFHFWLREELRPEEHPERKDDQGWREIKDMVAKQDGPWPPPVFIHGDLSPANILVRGNRIAAVINWATAGWYPYYWEYTSTWYGSSLLPTWQDALDTFIDPCPAKVLAMEITRQKWWGEI